MKDYAQLAQEWLEAVQSQESVDYGDPKSVRRYNRATDRYRKIAGQIDENHREKVREFAEFLKSDDPYVQSVCAFCLLGLTHYPMDLEECALNVIRKGAETKFTYVFWLERWQNGEIMTQYKKDSEAAGITADE